MICHYSDRDNRWGYPTSLCYKVPLRIRKTGLVSWTRELRMVTCEKCKALLLCNVLNMTYGECPMRDENGNLLVPLQYAGDHQTAVQTLEYMEKHGEYGPYTMESTFPFVEEEEQ